MGNNIEAIFLDVGNTLRIVVPDEPVIIESKRKLVELTGSNLSPDDFFSLLEDRYKALRNRAKEQLIEASEKEMWTQWMLPDYPAEKIAPPNTASSRSEPPLTAAMTIATAKRGSRVIMLIISRLMPTSE